MAYEQTEVPVSRSQEAIRKLILQNNGTGVAFITHGLMEGFEAYVEIEGKPYRMRMEAECGKGIPARKSSSATEIAYEQDRRRIWRVLFHQMKSVYECSKSGVVEFRQLVLAFIVTKDNRTVGERILPKLDEAVAGRPERLLLPAAHVDAEVVE